MEKKRLLRLNIIQDIQKEGSWFILFFWQVYKTNQKWKNLKG